MSSAVVQAPFVASSHIRYGGFGGLAMRHISSTYIALFTHFIPRGVWEAIYIIEGQLRHLLHRPGHHRRRQRPCRARASDRPG
ncbi:Tn3 family transposase [Nocardia sp. NPDC051463]|uniref:Tn3 family transposase n=1 Tax=Nocardia sp. NPDC051463 TaxID=3154845 RepID=UPI00341D03C2